MILHPASLHPAQQSFFFIHSVPLFIWGSSGGQNVLLSHFITIPHHLVALDQLLGRRERAATLPRTPWATTDQLAETEIRFPTCEATAKKHTSQWRDRRTTV